MKRIFLFACFMFVVMNIMAYQSMVREGYSWSVIYSDGDDADEVYRYYTRVEKIEGDSVVDGVVYKKLWENNSLLALIREDASEQKVFAYNDGVEVLLYDLSANVGDRVSTFGCLSDLKSVNESNVGERERWFVDAEVVEVGVMLDEVYGQLKTVTYCDVKNRDIKWTVCERYGAWRGWATSPRCMIIGGTTGRVICAFDENGELVLKPKFTIEGYGDVEDCSLDLMIDTSVDELHEDKVARGAFYDSKTRRLNVDVDCAVKVMVRDALGRCLLAKWIAPQDNGVSLLNVVDGFYIVEMYDSRGKRVSYFKILAR